MEKNQILMLKSEYFYRKFAEALKVRIRKEEIRKEFKTNLNQKEQK
jgi:hypothetical protein